MSVEKALGLKSRGDGDRNSFAGRDNTSGDPCLSPALLIPGCDADNGDIDGPRPMGSSLDEPGDKPSGLAIRSPPND